MHYLHDQFRISEAQPELSIFQLNSISILNYYCRISFVASIARLLTHEYWFGIADSESVILEAPSQSIRQIMLCYGHKANHIEVIPEQLSSKAKNRRWIK